MPRRSILSASERDSLPPTRREGWREHLVELQSVFAKDSVAANTFPLSLVLLAYNPSRRIGFDMIDKLHESHPEIVKRLRRADGHLQKVIAMI